MTPEEQVVRAYEEHRDALFRYLVHLGLAAPAAQENTQEVFLRLHTAVLDGAEIRHMRAWLFTVAHNLAMDCLGAESAELALPRAPTSPPSPEQQLLADERLDHLARAVASLSPQQQRCLHVRAEGLRYREIGEVLGIQTSTAAEFIRRAVVLLRKALYE